MIKSPLTNVYKSNCYLDPVNTSLSKYKSNRGGSWEYSEGYPANVSFRFFDESDKGYKDLGFRCAASGKKTSWIARKLDGVIDPIFSSNEMTQLNELSDKKETLNPSLIEKNIQKAQEPREVVFSLE